jgi:hypothetical protein
VLLFAAMADVEALPTELLWVPLGLLGLMLLAIFLVAVVATICFAGCWTMSRAADAVLGVERDV